MFSDFSGGCVNVDCGNMVNGSSLMNCGSKDKQERLVDYSGFVGVNQGLVTLFTHDCCLPGLIN